MKEVILHVYDVTNSDSEKTNNTILQINRIFKDRIGLGGIFHSAIQVYGEEEWSFGFCDHGSGVFSCPPGKNTMYTYREKIVLGETDFSNMEVNQIIRELSREWPGNSYDLLAKNCNHFCDIFCDRLGIPKLPGWVNRFANAGDTAIVAAGNAAVKFRQAKSEIVNASRVAYRFMAGLTTSNNTATITNNNNNNNINSNSNSNNNNGNDANTPESELPKFQSMFKSMVSPKQNKPANSSSVPDTDESVGMSINADTDKLYSLKPRQASFQSDDESSAANLRGKE